MSPPLSYGQTLHRRFSAVVRNATAPSIDPHVEPRRFTANETGRIVVDVHQVVRDLSGKVVTDRMVQHIYLVEGGLISHIEIGS